jgi:hypothetical protein
MSPIKDARTRENAASTMYRGFRLFIERRKDRINNGIHSVEVKFKNMNEWAMLTALKEKITPAMKDAYVFSVRYMASRYIKNAERRKPKINITLYEKVRLICWNGKEIRLAIGESK